MTINPDGRQNRQQDEGVTPAGPGLRPFGAEPQDASQAKPLVPNAGELAHLVEGFLARSDREEMRLILDAVNRGIMGAIERERRYASRCDGAMMAALALASKSRLSPDLTRTLSMRVGANLLPADGRSALEREFVASAIDARRAADSEAGAVHESAVAKPDAQTPSP